jgi:hypothetical protein
MRSRPPARHHAPCGGGWAGNVWVGSLLQLREVAMKKGGMRAFSAQRVRLKARGFASMADECLLGLLGSRSPRRAVQPGRLFAE